MFPTNFYDPDAFIDSVIEDCKLGEAPANVLEKLREAIEMRLNDRIMITIVDNLTDEDAALMQELLRDYPGLDSFDAIMILAPTLPHLKESFEKNLRELYEELTFNAASIEEEMAATEN